jgi:transcriptional regulator with XRE-family HTH domain
MADLMNNSNAMDIDIIAGQNQNINDYMIALLTQQQELELSGMNPQYISNLEKKLREYQQNNGTENDEEIARLLQENFIKEQEMINALGGNDQNLGMIPKSNSNKVDVNLINYHNSELQRQYRQRHNKEKLSHEYFRSKLNSNEALPIKKQVRDFYIDFEQKSKNVFQSPEEQCQYLRYFLFNLSKELIENPLWANSDKEEQENAIIEMEKLITKKLFDITYGPSEDIAKDTLLSHKIQMHSWVEPRHFDLSDFDYHIFEKAGNELQKMNLYKFYIDKMICIVNCIKLIEDAYRKNVTNKDSVSNDEILSLLIFVILKTNPKKLISNILYIVRYANPSFFSIGIYEYALTSIWSSVTFIESISQTSLTIDSEEYDAKIIEMTEITKELMDESNIDPNLVKASNSNNGGIFESVMGLFQSIIGNENSYNDGDIPYQGIFGHLDSVRSSLSGNSITINEYRKELREKSINSMNEPFTTPFDDSVLSEKEQTKLFEVDKELKASLSINSNKE